MTVEVTLEVEVGQLVRLRHLEELAEGGIRRDVVLVLEVLLLHVVVDLLRDVGAADQRARGVTEELVQLIRDLRGDLEDARATRLGTLLTLGTDATLAATGILDLAVDTLVKTLDLRDHGADRLAERRERGQNTLEVLIQRRGRGSRLRGRRRGRGSRARGRGSRNRGHRGNRGRHDSRLGRRRLAARLDLLGRRGNDRGRRGNNYRGSNNNNLLNLLLNLLGRGLRNDGGTHHTSSVGRIHGK